MVFGTTGNGQNPLYFIIRYFGSTHYSNKSKKGSKILAGKYFLKAENVKNRKWWKRRAPGNPWDCSNQILKILNMGSISSKNIKLKFLNKDFISRFVLFWSARPAASERGAAERDLCRKPFASTAPSRHFRIKTDIKSRAREKCNNEQTKSHKLVPRPQKNSKQRPSWNS